MPGNYWWESIFGGASGAGNQAAQSAAGLASQVQGIGFGAGVSQQQIEHANSQIPIHQALVSLSQQSIVVNHGQNWSNYSSTTPILDFLQCIGGMSSQVSADIFQITLSIDTYARFISEIGTIRYAIDRDEYSDSYFIHTPMGRIKISCCPPNSSASINLDKYMEDV